MENVEMDDFDDLPYGNEDEYEAETRFNDLDDEETKLLQEHKYWKGSFIRKRLMAEKDAFKTGREKLEKEHIEYISDFFNKLQLEEEISGKSFIRYLLSNDYIVVNAELSYGVLESNYEFRYDGSALFLKNGLTVGAEDLLRSNVRSVYDDYVKYSNDKLMKKAGIMTAVGLSIIALVTGLSVGLKRKGNDLVHQSKKWEKLQPAEKIDNIAWTKLTDATGRSLVFTGRYLTVILIGAGVYLAVKKVKK